MAQTLALPLSVTPTGALGALTQGSPGELGQALAVLLATVVGERRSEPGYGTTAMLATSYRPALAHAAIATWEPRAIGASITVIDPGSGAERVVVDVSTARGSS